MVSRNMYVMLMLLINFVSPAVLLVPGLCRAYLDGLAAARDPAHRVMLPSPWFFFHRTFLRRLRGWWFLLALVCLLILAFWWMIYYPGAWRWRHPYYWRYLWLRKSNILLLWLLSFLLIVDLLASIFAPFCRRVWTLTFISLFGYPLVCLASIQVCLWVGVLHPAVSDPIWEQLDDLDYRLGVAGFWILAAAGVHFCRHCGHWWFRFER